MAPDVVADALHEMRERTTPEANDDDAHDSAHVPLPGGDFASRETLMADARAATNDGDVGEHLVYAYGTGWTRVWRYTLGDAGTAERIVPELPYLMAEVPHAVEHELACTLSDVLIRRTQIAFETRDHGRSTARRIAPLMGTELGWSDEQRHRALADYDADATRIFSIDT